MPVFVAKTVRICSWVLGVILAAWLTVILFEGNAGASEAPAETGGYPDANAPCVANEEGITRGSGAWCKGYRWGYYVRNKGRITGSVQISPRGFSYRNCTDWAAFRAQQLTGVLVPYGARMGDGRQWNENGLKAGYAVDDTPEPGDIAVWEATATSAYGHVAVVESVSGDDVAVSDYNRMLDGDYHARTMAADSPASYVDVNGAGKGSNGEVLAPADTTVARPAAVVHSGLLHVLVRGKDGRIYDQYWNGAGWTGYASIGGSMQGNPAVVSNGDALSVFAVGTDGRVYTKYNNGSGWTGWASLGGVTVRGSPRAIQYGGEVSVFVLGTDGHPYKNTWQSGSGWGGWTNMGNYMDSSPAPIQYGTELDVIMRGGDCAIYKNTWNGSGWGGFGSLGTCLAGNPDVISYGGQLDIWSNAPGNHIWKRTWNGSAWGSWTDMGGNYAGDPEVMQYGNDLEVFVRGTNAQMYTRFWSASGRYWSSWASLGGSIAGEPTAIQYGAELSVFAVGGDGRTYKNTFFPNSGWGGFTLLPG
jgi:surface antigen